MQRPTLSVIMPNYNHARFLIEAVQSILDQSFQPMEIIILDDASTDNSMELLQQLAQAHSQIRLIRNEQNRGIIYNLNRLLELVSGDYLYGMAADDKILPGFLEKSMCLLEQHPQAGLCSTRSWMIDEASHERGIVRTPAVARDAAFLTPADARRALLRYGSWVMGNTAIYRRQALVEAGGFIPELGPFCDGFIQQVISLRHGACFIPEPLAAWRQLETGYSLSTGADIERSLAIRAYASTLMRSTYRDVFPPEYVAEYERDSLYSLVLLSWNNVRREQQKMFTQWRRLPLRSWIDSLFMVGLYWSTQLQRLAILLYAIARFRLSVNWLRRQLKKIY